MCEVSFLLYIICMLTRFPTPNKVSNIVLIKGYFPAPPPPFHAYDKLVSAFSHALIIVIIPYTGF